MKRRKGNILLLLLAGIAIIASAAAGYFYFQNRQLKSQTTPAPTITPTPTPVDETANWKTYIDSQERFTFKYPSSLIVSTTGFIGGSGKIRTVDYDPSKPEQGYNVEMQVYSNPKYLDDQVKFSCIIGMTGEKIDNCKTTEVVINGSKAVVADYGNGVRSYLIYGNSLGIAFRPASHYLQSHQDILDQILSTFKFLQ